MTTYGVSTTSLVAISTGILGSAWASGTIASFSIFAVPVARSFPSSTTKMWYELYAGGKAVMPKVGVAVALAYAYAAYESHSRGAAWKGFLGAAGLVISIVPFTLIAMASTNATLTKSAHGASSLTAAQESQVVSRWIVLNLVRSFLPLAGAVTGLVAFLNNTS